ncbi:MAG TPA: protein kinase [Isosphaeraceae bacterium]|nr:protein kinase [Isosphaeraceae bacterium]
MSHHEQGTIAETPAWSSDSTESPVRDLTGTTLGDFEVKRLLGRGGMGQVYLATQTSLNRPVALKVLHPHYLSKPIYLTRFEAEATAVAKLNHPNIVHVYTLGYVDQVRFIAMEYVEGTNLREYINKKGALDLPLALSIMRQAGQAIGAAGEVGLVHRDIKPENLLLTRKGRAKVADFGLCRDLGADRLHVTQPGTTMGTPLYMSPEQAQGKPLDHRSDLYSLGVTFYHMLSGEPPFRADSAVAVALKHVSELPVSLRVRRPDIPIELERLVLKLMAKSPADRYQSAAEMLADLAKIRASLQPTLGSIGDENAISLPRVDEATKAGSGSAVALAATTATSTVSLVTGQLYRPRSLLLTGMIFVLVGAALGWGARPSDLPGGDLVARRLPGLAIEPRWALIPRQDSAEEQYRYAQLRASDLDLAAAWLAIPGFHSHSPEWVSPAYLQFSRRLYRQGDQDRLSAFKGELVAWRAAKTRDQELARIIDCALKLLNQDLDGVIDGTSRIAGPDERARAGARDEPNIYDPGLLEFSVEILADALKLASQSVPQAAEIKKEKLVGIQNRLISYLRRVRMSEWASR